jgi:hypothetical protein
VGSVPLSRVALDRTELGSPAPAAQPLLEQGDLGRELLEAAGEVRQPLLRRPACHDPTARSPSAVLT